MSNPRRRNRLVVGVVAVAAAGLLGNVCGCSDSGADDSPDDDEETTSDDGTDTSGTTGRTEGGGGGGEDEDRWLWGLPPGDTSVSANEAIIYLRLLQDECGSAQDSLDEAWRSLNGPRAVLLYQAAIHFCFGDKDAGQRVFEQAGEQFGWTGVAWPSLDCNVYKTIRSVLEQRDPDGFECAGGDIPEWPSSDPAGLDDPRTPANEGAGTGGDTTSSTTTSSTTTSSTTTSSTSPPNDTSLSTTTLLQPLVPSSG